MTTDDLPFPDTLGNRVFYLPEAMEVDGKTFPRNAKLILTTHEDGSREIGYTPMVTPPLPPGKPWHGERDYLYEAPPTFPFRHDHDTGRNGEYY